ncbi:MAG TPA: helix-turn-helix transcriptional regulator [archaeon]|nr:helix-turn-helix transcriptional regulator [archaeon]
MEKSNTTKYFLLNELRRKSMHGYEIITALGKITGKKPSPSQIYPVLSKMKSLDYVTVKVKSEGKKKMKFYTLTKSGRQMHDSMNKQFEIMMRSAFKEKIKICAHCDCEMIGHTHTKKIGGRLHHFCCPSCAASYMK